MIHHSDFRWLLEIPGLRNLDEIYKIIIHFGRLALDPRLEIYFESWSSDRLGGFTLKIVTKQRRHVGFMVGLRLRNAEQSVLSVVVFVGLCP